MSKIRILIKETFQPPIDTPVSIKWRTIEVDNDELTDLFQDHKRPRDLKKHKHSTFEVVGAELIDDGETL